MNQVLKIALEISNGNEIRLNRNEILTEELINERPNSNLYNSLYFKKNGVTYRVSNHELPNRDFMSTHSWVTNELAKEKGVKQLYYENNIEVIVKNGEIVKTKLNFN